MHLASHLSSNIVSHISVQEESPPTGELIDADWEFNSSTGWTLGSEFSIAGGQLTCLWDNSESVAEANFVQPLTSTDTYVLRLNVASVEPVAPANFYGKAYLYVDGATLELIDISTTGLIEQTFTNADFPGYDFDTAIDIHLQFYPPTLPETPPGGFVIDSVSLQLA